MKRNNKHPGDGKQQKTRKPYKKQVSTPLSQFWNHLRTHVATAHRYLSDEICHLVVEKVIMHCLPETTANRHCLLLWLLRITQQLRDLFFSVPTTDNIFGDLKRYIAGLDKRDLFCFEPGEPESGALAIQKLAASKKSSKLHLLFVDYAIAEVNLLLKSPLEFEFFTKQTNFNKLKQLPQMVAIVLAYLRDDPAVRMCLFEEQEFSRFCDVEMSDASLQIRRLSDLEFENLLFTANIMRIAVKLVDIETPVSTSTSTPKVAVDNIEKMRCVGKGRVMSISSQLAEARVFPTGSGNSAATKRREKLFELLSGVRPTSRSKIPCPQMTLNDPNRMSTCDDILANMIWNAFEDLEDDAFDDLTISSKREECIVAEFENNNVHLHCPVEANMTSNSSIGSIDSHNKRAARMSKITCDIRFNNYSVGHVQELGLIFDNEEKMVVSVKSVLNIEYEDPFFGDEIEVERGDEEEELDTDVDDEYYDCLHDELAFFEVGMMRAVSTTGNRAMARTLSSQQFIVTSLGKHMESAAISMGYTTKETVWDIDTMKRKASNQSVNSTGSDRSPRKRRCASGDRQAFDRFQQLDMEAVFFVPDEHLRSLLLQDFIECSGPRDDAGELMLNLPPSFNSEAHSADGEEESLAAPGVHSGRLTFW